MDLLGAATPLQIAALWRLDLLSPDEIAAVCMRWLEEGLDQIDPEVAALAGRQDLTLGDAGPTFAKILQTLIGRLIGEDEATLRALHLHLAASLKSEDFMGAVSLLLARFASRYDRRMVFNPRRARDHPDGDYAQQELGLEYIYGGFYAFDDVQWLPQVERTAAEVRLMQQLREDVRELHDHLETELKPA